MFKLRNTTDLQTLLKMLGLVHSVNPDVPMYITFEDIAACLKVMGVTD